MDWINSNMPKSPMNFSLSQRHDKLKPYRTSTRTQLMIDQTNKRTDRAIARQRRGMNARGKNLRRRVMKHGHQTLAARLAQHSVCRKLCLRHLAAREVVNRSFRDTDPEVLLDAKEQIQKVHRCKAEVVKEKLFGFNRFRFLQGERLFDQIRHLFKSILPGSSTPNGAGLNVVRVHAV